MASCGLQGILAGHPSMESEEVVSMARTGYQGSWRQTLMANCRHSMRRDGPGSESVLLMSW